MPLSERQVHITVDSHADRILERAFRDVEQSDIDPASRLREAIRRYVDGTKTRHETPERVIIAVKEIARKAGIGPSLLQQSSLRPFTERDTAFSLAVTWCIERYYETEPSRGETANESLRSGRAN